jgi:DnaJ-class molecular chaperone with C-terminal Zn finger domain
MSSHKHPRTEIDLDGARKLLRVSMGATKKEIEKSFRQLAKTLHPDRTSNREANERFFETCDAKEVLLYHVDPEIEIDSDIEIDLDRFLLHHLDTEIDSDRARKLLRVSKDATKQEIEKSFRQLALTLHPDRTSNRKQMKDYPRLSKRRNCYYITLMNYMANFL